MVKSLLNRVLLADNSAHSRVAGISPHFRTVLYL